MRTGDQSEPMEVVDLEAEEEAYHVERANLITPSVPVPAESGAAVANVVASNSDAELLDEAAEQLQDAEERPLEIDEGEQPTSPTLDQMSIHSNGSGSHEASPEAVVEQAAAAAPLAAVVEQMEEPPSVVAGAMAPPSVMHSGT